MILITDRALKEVKKNFTSLDLKEISQILDENIKEDLFKDDEKL